MENLILNPDSIPDMEKISKYVNNPLWNKLCNFIESAYNVTAQFQYSKCSMQTGWNVKYKKGSKSICTLYPEKDGFICLVVISGKEIQEAELYLTGCESYVQQLYKNSQPINGARWLMINAVSPEIVDNITGLISIRVKPRV